MSHCTPEMDTKLQVMETQGKIDTKQNGVGLISLICDVTYRRYEMSQTILNIFRADKELMLCHQKEHILLTQDLAEFKARNEVVSGEVGKPGHHQEAAKLVKSKQEQERSLKGGSTEIIICSIF